MSTKIITEYKNTSDSERRERKSFKDKLLVGTAGFMTAMGAFALAGCAPEVKALEVEYTTSFGTEIPIEVAQDRTKALELCNTGEGAAEVANIWTHAKYDLDTGMTFPEALEYAMDWDARGGGAKSDTAEPAIYRNLAELPQDCYELTYLTTSGWLGIINAAETLKEYRNGGDINASINNLRRIIFDNKN